MVALARFTPVIVGWLAGVVWPAEMVTEGEEIETVLGSLLARAMVTEDAGGEDRETAKGSTWPSPTLPAGGRFIPPALATVTLNVALAMPGATAAAVMVAEPCATAVTGTFKDAAFAGTNTLAGTVATPTELEVRFTRSPPAGAGPDKLRATFCVTIPLMVTVGDPKVMMVVTCTEPLVEL